MRYSSKSTWWQGTEWGHQKAFLLSWVIFVVTLLLAARLRYENDWLIANRPAKDTLTPRVGAAGVSVPGATAIGVNVPIEASFFRSTYHPTLRGGCPDHLVRRARLRMKPASRHPRLRPRRTVFTFEPWCARESNRS